MSNYRVTVRSLSGTTSHLTVAATSPLQACRTAREAYYLNPARDAALDRVLRVVAA